MNRTHFLIYYVRESGSYIITTPRLWAKANLHHFPNNNDPRTHAIETYLIENYGFVESVENEETSVIYNFNIHIPPANGIPF